MNNQIKDGLNNNGFNLQFMVSNIKYRNEETHYTIFEAKKLIFEDNNNIKQLDNYIVKGVFDTCDYGDYFKSVCEWEFDNKFGWQLKASSSVITLPSNVAGIKRFLKKFVRGVGDSTVNKLISAYGVDTLEKIKEGVENISCLSGIGTKKAIKIRASVLKHDAIEKLSVFLFSKGITNYNDILSIYEEFKENSIDVIKANPYVICDKVSVSKLPIADTIALNSGMGINSVTRLTKIILAYLNYRSYACGDFYSPMNVIKASIFDFMKKNGLAYASFDESAFNEAFKVLCDCKNIVVDDFDNEKNVYLYNLHSTEIELADIVRSMCQEKKFNLSDKELNQFFDKFCQDNGFTADEKQKLAVKYAYEYQFLVITGGAGAGKTHTVNSIIKFLEHKNKNVNIVLTAPTGRASRRMSEVTNRHAQTIHKLLGLRSEADFNSNYNIELNADYIICDECSMIDAHLFLKLLRVAKDNNISLILVGDKSQLAPVGVGLVFKDLVESGVVPTVILDKLFRQAQESQINLNARKVLNGVKSDDKDGLTFDINKQDFFFFPAKNPMDIRRLILASIDKLISLGTSLSDIVVLSSLKKTTLGVVEINKMMQAHYNPPSSTKEEVKGNTYTFREGDKVMQIKNNYDLNVFNGDIGVVKKIDNDEEIIIVSYDYHDEDVLYEFSMLDELSLSYSMTVHKAQGSEFPVVLMPMDNLLVNLSRNILYTSITRAKKRFVMVGNSEHLYKAIDSFGTMDRYTKLKERLISKD